MRRVVSVWLPTFSTDRLKRHGTPCVVAAHDGRRTIVFGANAEAQALGLAAGMPLAHANALVPGLEVAEHAPAEDAAALTRLALGCLRYAPLVAADPPAGLWLDIAGCAHLAGGEAALLTDLVARLEGAGYAARAAVADTPGAAHAIARFGRDSIVPEGGARAALAPLPVQALRLPDTVCDGLLRLGFAQVGQLLDAPRAPLVRRFGAVLAQRLAQALGEEFESIRPLTPPDTIQRRLAFVEPIGTADAFATAIARLLRPVCARLERASRGVRRLDLLFERVDGSVQAIRIGTVRPARDPTHLGRLLCERLEQVDPGEGVEAMHLIAAATEPLAFAQLEAEPLAETVAADVAGLVDRLVNRLGEARVYRAAAVESDVPERSVAHVAPLSPPTGASWPPALPRPARLLSPPQPVAALAPLPDHPPAAFTWRNHRHRVRHADGPERIVGEWWKRDSEWLAVRDYFAVEDEQGRRFWLFRHGDGLDLATGDLSWFLHGLF